jgi:hypothetical protein
MVDKGKYLAVVNHMNSLEDNAFSVLSQELKDVLYLRFIREPAQSYAVLART